MKYQILLEPRAEADIEVIYLFIARRNRESAIKWFNGISAAIQTLETFPQRCPHAPENAFFQEEIREHFYGKRVGTYRILFTIVDQTVHVLHVRHGRRQWFGQE
jgi:plasmid stabilization system protein ParE